MWFSLSEFIVFIYVIGFAVSAVAFATELLSSEKSPDSESLPRFAAAFFVCLFWCLIFTILPRRFVFELVTGASEKPAPPRSDPEILAPSYQLD